MIKPVFWLLCFLWQGVAFAQTAKKSFWVAKAGLMRTALNSSPLLYTADDIRQTVGYTFGNSDFRTGLHAELGREWQVRRAWRVQANLGYRQYGGSFYRQPNTPTYENRLDYVTAGGLVRFMVLPDDKVSPYFVGGVRLGRLITSPRNEVTEKLLYRDQPFRAIDVVPTIGVGLEFPILRQRFFTEVEYSYGSTSIMLQTNQYNSNFSQRAVAFTLGAKF